MATVFKINDIDYECEFKLSNPDDQEISFTKSAIRGMTLVDNVFDPFMSGTVSIANPYDFIENDYFVRGDGRDEFLIKFKPKDTSKSTDPKNDKYDHTFIIVNDSDTSNPMVRSENIKTFSLISKDSIPFTDTSPYAITYSGKIGAILKEIFKEVLGDDRVDEDNWEDGDFEISEYTPPATFRYIDTIQELMRAYYAKDEEIYVKGFIRFDKETDKFRLDLLSKIYSDNDKNTIEAFAVGDLVTDIGFDNENNPPSGPPVGEYIGGLRNLGYSTPLYSWTSDYFINSLVFGYDSILGQQKIRKIKFDDIKEKWKKKFVDPFKASGKVKPFAIKNKTTDKRFKRFSYPYNVDDSVKMVEAEIHNALTFYNLQSSFSNIGSTVRQAGKFIDIFSPKKNGPKLKSEQKILGRWYVTEVRHIFFADLYTNEVYCTKTYIGPKAKIQEDVE
jgi:hypothetical protein|tara:strand:- start:2010 stop:3347 length:1338 start_codon:yes stop_codon:yes gene_type:complete